MSERTHSRADAYFRNPDTRLASALRHVSPNTGEDYRRGKTKRVVETAIALPMWVASRPVEVAAKTVVRFVEKEEPTFRHARMGGSSGETVFVDKIRTLYDQTKTTQGKKAIVEENNGVIDDSIDPRVTRTGKILRPLKLDELPQLKQVINGKLSLVGMRALALHDFEGIRSDWPPERSEKWQNGYFQGRPALASLYDAFFTRRDHRYHPDVFYARHASLNLDLYTLYQSARKIMRQGGKIKVKAVQKLSFLGKNIKGPQN